MAQDERNFRSTYYEKVGFRSVEEKRSLDILLKEKPLDRGRLKQFCLRFSVPSTYRNYVWKILLGILGTHSDSHAFTTTQHEQEFNNLLRGLKILGAINENTPKGQLFLTVWLFRTKYFFFENKLSTESGYVLIVHSLMQFIDNDVDIYWLSKCFYESIINFRMDFPRLLEVTWNLLEKEDLVLFKHLQDTSILVEFPVMKWFESGFAGVLHENGLGKIWDKLCGGSYKIMAYVVVVLFMNQRRKLLKCQNAEAAQKCFDITEEAAEIVATKSIDMWQQHGSPLTIHDKPKPSQ